MKTLSFALLLFFSTCLLGQEKINWISIEEAEAASKKQPKKILIDVYTDWCGWCKRMDANTFQKEEVAKLVNEKYYAVKLDGEQKDSIVFKGKTYKFVAKGRRGYNELAALLLQGRLAYPSIVYLDENLNLIRPWPGYKGPEEFLLILSYIIEDHYLQGTFEDYKLKQEKAQD